MKKYRIELKSLLNSEYRHERNVADLARDFKPCYHTIQTWVRTADLQGAQPEESSQNELKLLRREYDELPEDRANLEKASAWFANRH